MKGFKLFILLTVLFISDYAFAQIPSCPCDTLELSNGLTGNEIVDLLCPGGSLGEETIFELTPDLVLITTDIMGYSVQSSPENGLICEFGEDSIGSNGAKLTAQEYENCRTRLIVGCRLNSRTIPTLSEWGLIAMAGALGIVALIVARRRKSTA
jgi:hypothetical protein